VPARFSPLPLAFALLLAACGPGPEPPLQAGEILTGEAGEWVDLTHAFSDEAVYWPTARPFELEEVAYGETEAGYFYAAYAFSAAEHGGTHLDAPIHFAREGATAEEVELDRLIGPGVVVDVTERAARNPDYRVRIEDLEAWEDRNGVLPEGAIVLLRTGWSQRWPDPVRYLGTDRRGPEAVDDLHFPGLHPDAARWLVERGRVAGVGIDTPSLDHGPSTEFRAHRILYAANLPGFENVAHLDALPERGAYVVALPMKIEGGSGAPLRIVAFVPR